MSSFGPGPRKSPGERREWRDALLTFGPAIVVAFVLEWTLRTQWGWTPRQALWTSVAVGIGLALVLQRATRRRDRS